MSKNFLGLVMIKYFFTAFIFLFLLGCGGSGSSSSTQTSTLVQSTQYQASILHDSNNCTATNTITAATNRPMLVVLINYDNISITSQNSIWKDKMFSKGNSQLNHYYLEASSKQFEFAQVTETVGCSDDGVVSVQIHKDHPNSNNLEAIYPDLKTALSAVDAHVDFSNYDSNANGFISSDELLFTFIIAGYEDSYEGYHVENGVWAHEYCMESTLNIPTLDGVSLMACQNGGNFSLFGERHGKTNPHNATIGIIAHELGHSAFSLPDLYNTTNQYKGGIGYFGLMGSGTWAMQASDSYPGNTPVHFSAWSKVYNNWVTPTTTTGYNTLYASSSSNYNVVKVPINATSYYLIENRDNSGYDKGLYSLSGMFDGGIAIWEIDTTKLTAQHLEDNDVNADTQNKAVDLVEASASNIDSTGGKGDEDALYYTPNQTSLAGVVSNVSARGSTMSLNVN